MADTPLAQVVVALATYWTDDRNNLAVGADTITLPLTGAGTFAVLAASLRNAKEHTNSNKAICLCITSPDFGIARSDRSVCGPTSVSANGWVRSTSLRGANLRANARRSLCAQPSSPCYFRYAL